MVQTMLRNHASLLKPVAGEIVAALSGLDVEGDLLQHYLAHVMVPQTLEQRADNFETWHKMFGASVHEWLDQQRQQVLTEMYPAAAATLDPVPTRPSTSLLPGKAKRLFADDAEDTEDAEDPEGPPLHPSETNNGTEEDSGREWNVGVL